MAIEDIGLKGFTSGDSAEWLRRTDMLASFPQQRARADTKRAIGKVFCCWQTRPTQLSGQGTSDRSPSLAYYSTTNQIRKWQPRKNMGHIQVPWNLRITNCPLHFLSLKSNRIKFSLKTRTHRLDSKFEKSNDFINLWFWRYPQFFLLSSTNKRPIETLWWPNGLFVFWLCRTHENYNQKWQLYHSGFL